MSAKCSKADTTITLKVGRLIKIDSKCKHIRFVGAERHMYLFKNVFFTLNSLKGIMVVIIKLYTKHGHEKHVTKIKLKLYMNLWEN